MIEQILNISTQQINSADVSFFDQYSFDGHKNKQYLYGEAGVEHYRFFVEISKIINNKLIFDVGTYLGMSALAFSYNSTNKVKSYDIFRAINDLPQKENIDYKIGDAIKDSALQSADIIFLDVNHDGLYEREIFNHLKSIGWKGILILDDIYLNDEMIRFWKEIEYKKYDITHLGHWSGTGLVKFGEL